MALNGVVDYGRAKALDPGWWRRWHILRLAAQAADAQTLRLAMVGAAAAAGASNQPQALVHREDAAAYVYPQLGSTASERAAKLVVGAEHEFKRITGYDLNSPEYQAYEDAVIAEWNKNAPDAI